MTPIVNYVIAVYGGSRRSYGKPSPIDVFIREHIEFLLQYPLHIKYVTFVFNESDNPQEEELKREIISKLSPSSLKCEILTKPNEGFSYGAWDYALHNFIENHDITHHFLIEDDYLPQQEDFLEYFLKCDSDDVKYVASMWKDNHAALSSGLIRHGRVQSVFKEKKKIFEIAKGDKYIFAFSSQRNFLNNLPGRGVDVLGVGRMGYLHPLNNTIKRHGKEDSPILIDPIKIEK